jgi:hypothetical protein
VQPELGIFYTCFTEKAAVEYSLESLFKHYPSIPVYLVSDGGTDFKYLESTYPSLRALLEEDTRGCIPSINETNFTTKDSQDKIKHSITTFVDRIERAIHFCNSKYLLIIEPDVLVRGKLNIPKDGKIFGSRVNSGLSDELKSILVQRDDAIVIDTWGVTPALFECKSFKRCSAILKNDKELFDSLCLADYRLAAYDVLLPVMYALIGEHEIFNPDITECMRNPLWQSSTHPLLHQYRAKYQNASDGYTGRHSRDNYWPWKD